MKQRGNNSIKSILLEFCKETSISGISNVGKEGKSVHRKAIWFLIFLAGASLTGWSLIQVITELLQFPTTTSVTYDYLKKVIFRFCLFKHLKVANLIACLPDSFSGCDNMQSKPNKLWIT